MEILDENIIPLEEDIPSLIKGIIITWIVNCFLMIGLTLNVNNCIDKIYSHSFDAKFWLGFSCVILAISAFIFTSWRSCILYNKIKKWWDNY